MRPSRLVVVMIASACVGSGCAWQQLLNRSTPSQEEQIEALIRTIDDDADVLHSDHTPSVHKLIDIGEPVIPRMLDLMLLDGPHDHCTRLHAQTVLFYIIAGKNGFGERGWSEPNGGLARANDLWKALGDLDYNAPLAERERAVKLWREWLTKNKTH